MTSKRTRCRHAWLALAALWAGGAGVGCSDDETNAASTTGIAPTGGAGTGASGGQGTGGSAAGGDGGGETGGSSPGCEACAAVTVAGAVADEAVAETSGLAASTLLADTWFAHNDSGDAPRFFAFATQGESRGTFTVTGAEATDWEDMARGPCGGPGSSSCLYFADIGDNDEVRTSYAIYRVPEPAAPGDAMVAAESLPFAYPDGSHNAETLLVHPVSGEIAVVTKVSSGPSSIYVFPTAPTPGVQVTLQKVGEVKPPGLLALVTGGDVHPTGTSVLLRTYVGLWLYEGAAGDSIAALLASEPCAAPFASEQQGEAVAWSADGASYVTVSEGVGPAIHHAACSTNR